MKVAIFDTAFGSTNLGDQIIMESIDAEAASLFPDAFILRVPTHAPICHHGRKLLDQADIILAGGTNLLFSHWKKSRQWLLEPSDLASIAQKLVLMGTGWTTYLQPPDRKTRRVYKKILSPTALHSLRDSYSVHHLAASKFTNLLNTGCPTLWHIDNPSLNPEKSQSAITTVTSYQPDPQMDAGMISLLKDKYESVFLWPQGLNDIDYFQSLDINGVEILPPNLHAFDDLLLANEPIDYIGTRLHAGIRALQKKRRATILSIDNRAREMGTDFNLPVVERGNIDELSDYIDLYPSINLTIPYSTIKKWRNQFNKNLSAKSPSSE